MAGKKSKKLEKLKEKIERKYNTNLFTITEEIDNETYYRFTTFLRKIDKKSQNDHITILLSSNGGLSSVTNMLCKIISTRTCLIVVPCHAASAATQLLLAATEVWIDTYGYVTPIDDQINEISSANIVDCPQEFKEYPGRKIFDYDTIKDADISLNITYNLCCQILSNRGYDSKTIKYIDTLLIHHKVLHNTPIEAIQLNKYGLNHVTVKRLSKIYYKYYDLVRK